MTKINYKSIFMGFAHSVIVPFILILVSQNLFVGLVYYIVPFVAYETIASEKEGKAIFYVFSIFITFILLIAIGGM